MSTLKCNSKFILDDELCVEDEAHECVDAYLVATSELVERVKNLIRNDLTTDELESVDNINFYSYWNLKTGSVDLVSTFWYVKDNKETHHAVQICLTDAEAKELILAMNEYCRKRYCESCLGFLNEARTHEGLPIIDPPQNTHFYDSTLSLKALEVIDRQVNELYDSSALSNKNLSLDDRINKASAQADATPIANVQVVISPER